MRSLLLIIVLPIALLASACIGPAGTSCSVTDNGDGTSTITCTDGTSVIVGDGTDGTDGTSCTVTDNGDGTQTITCDDGTSVTVTDGESGGTCTISDNGDGTSTITCEDGTSVVVTTGEDGGAVGGARITSYHGSSYLQTIGGFAEGKRMVDATITGATADAAGNVTVTFTVADDGDPVIALGSFSATIAHLVPVFETNGVDYLDNQWAPYITRTQTVSGTGFPNPSGTTGLQGSRESNGTLTHDGDGAYTYVFATALPTGYDRGALHRVTIMMGGDTGPTADATLDFVPDGGTAPYTRDVVTTAACKGCHGEELAGHGGDRLSVENCATCHAAGMTDPHGGESLDLEVMIHKIHAGGELPTVAGADGNPWLDDDNGEYAIWGYQNQKHSWETVGFPAVIENCTKCHSGTGGDADNWKKRPTRAACGSCHDDIDFTTVGTHAGGPQANDDNCAVCHTENGLEAISVAHDWLEHDPRNIPEFTAEITLSAPANGASYAGSEAPVVTVVLERDGTPLADHRILKGSAQGCTPSGFPLACAADADGKYATTLLFVSGPRSDRQPVLTTKARAQIVSTTAGPFTFASATSLTVKLDQGIDTYLADAWHTRQLGTVTVPVPAATYTVDQLATLLNGNAAFTARAIAFNQGGFLGLRSRNKGKAHAIQLVAGDVTTAVFSGDVAVKAPGGFTVSNQLASNAASVGAIPAASDDPKVTLYADRIEYRLDPVADLEPGTYIVGLELSQLGRVDANNYRTPTIAKVPFEVGELDGDPIAEEPLVAGNCASCHQSAGGKGFVLDWSRHNKVFDDTALDQCGACHDYQPQDPNAVTGLSWSGARPISKRVHAIHYGSSLNYPLATVDYSNGDPITGRNWNITYPQDVRNCETCHDDETTSGTWATNPSRLACVGCHDGDAAAVHMRLQTWDPTPTTPWSGDEEESCATCH